MHSLPLVLVPSSLVGDVDSPSDNYVFARFCPIQNRVDNMRKYFEYAERSFVAKLISCSQSGLNVFECGAESGAESDQ